MIDHGRLFREAWIEGVRRHFPGEPKPGYVAPWEETPEWERSAAAAVCGQVLAFIDVSDGAVAKLSRDQRGRFLALCWTAQIYRAFTDPKPSYVADWDQLPPWQQAVDSDIFDALEKAASQDAST
ncbi:hypothetical protein [Actinoplanes palleronii]|uniref:Uncharacterized protein n=1 Tax=Actinoplanes palleronii TaxID=113570 RepID=A0ABQ4BKK5_9ACTN|nr:hypothetical protein [Actinoplanes palleronii]GIE70826.1 hypothetical protein Apa02nite_069340 [Actinoplanes palleronii]